MRVVLATDRMGVLDARQVGVALARAWADVAGAQCAVVPLGAAGGGHLAALAATEDVDVSLLPTGVDAPLALGVGASDVVAVALEPDAVEPGVPVAATSAPLGRAVADALAAWPHRPQLAVDLTWALSTHDAGAGLLAALGATADVPLDRGALPLFGATRVDLDAVRRRLEGIDLVGVVPADQVDAHLLGLRGISATRGHRAQLALADTMAADDALTRWASALAPAVAPLPGAGACGGAGLAILALGGRLATGPEHLGGRVGLAATLAQADLVVTACNLFGYHDRGGDVVTGLADLCAEVGVPLLVVADEVEIGAREMRTFGVEGAQAVALGEGDADDLAAATREVAASWRW